MNFETQSAIVAFGINLFLCIYVLIKRQGWRSTINRNFSVLSLAFSLWNLGIAITNPWLLHLGLFMASPALYLFLRTLLRFNKRVERHLNYLLWCVALIFIVVEYNNPYIPLFYSIFTFLMLSPIVAWGLYSLFDRVRMTSSRHEKLRYWYVLVGMAIAGLGGLTSFFHALGFKIVSLGIIGGIIYTILITISIIRYRLLDFGRIAGRAVVIMIFTLIFWLLIGIMGNWYTEMPYTSLLSILVASLILTVLYEPLMVAIQGQADRVLRRESYRFILLLSSFSRRMSAIVLEKELIRELAKTLRQSERIGSFGIYLTDHNSQQLILKEGDDIRWPIQTVLQTPTNLTNLMIHRQNTINRDDISRELRGGLPGNLRRNRIAVYRTMLRYRAQIATPFIFAEKFLGFLTLSFKDSEAEITQREEETLIATARQFAAALSHARLVAREQIKNRLAELGRISSGLAHEIRNPLATINAAVQYLQPTTENTAQTEFMEIIRDEVTRLNRFVQRFLTYARPIRQKFEHHTKPLEKIVNKIATHLKAQPFFEKIQILIDISEEASQIQINEDFITQILINLFENSAQAITGKGTIRFQAETLNDNEILRLIIEDDGIGIPTHDHEKIFQPFYTTQDKGTGLGLAIVNQIIDSWDGQIKISNSPFGGARLTIIIPGKSFILDDSSHKSSEGIKNE